MTAQDLALASEFPTATDEAWWAAVDKVLKGGSRDRLRSTTHDGITIEPLYTAAPHRVDERPGQPRYTRGRRAEGVLDGAWDIRQSYAVPDPVDANRLILEDLERGVTSVTVRLDIHGTGEVDGVVIGGLDDLDALFSGVHLDLITVVLDAGSAFADAAELLIELWDRRGTPSEQRRAELGADPLGVLARTGRLPQGLDAAWTAVAALARTTAAWPSVRVLGIDSAPWVDAGSSEGQELGAALAVGVASLRALTDAGMGIDEAAAQIGFTLAADVDVFATIAKFRAARRCWAGVIEACGGTPAAAAAPVAARTATRMMTRRDPWVNMLRTTAAAFAAGVAGASAVTVQPFDAAVGASDELARRVARNTQLLLQEESHVARVVDPAGGSFFLETLTDDLVAAAWAELGRIDAVGGVAAALADGSLSGRIAEVRAARDRNLARRREALTGVSEFPNLGEAPLDRAVPDATELRARAAAAAPPAPAGPPTTVEPIGVHRLAEAFEALRDASDAHLAATGSRPRIFLANLGPVAAHTARATFARNLFEAGGIEAVDAGGFDDDAALVAGWRASGTTTAVLCGDDRTYEARAVTAAAALKGAGLERLYLAGNPGDRRASEEAAGVDEFVHVGVDVLGVLRTAHDRLEVGA